MRAIIGIVALCITLSAAAADPVAVELSPPTQTIKAGEWPSFVVRVRATSSGVRIFNFERRTDLVDTYANLIVTRGAAPVRLLRAISDPLSVPGPNYVELAANNQLTFAHRGSPLAMSQLPPGTYEIAVLVRPYSNIEPVRSNTVMLEVREQ